MAIVMVLMSRKAAELDEMGMIRASSRKLFGHAHEVGSTAA